MDTKTAFPVEVEDPIGGDFYARRFQAGCKENTLVLNMGPQHPSTHGVLRVILEVDGEYILRAEPVLGYLHRMHEKMGEVKGWHQYIPNMGRVDYGHPLAWNWAYLGAVEKLAGLEVPERAEYIRIITCELNRLSSHLLWWGAYLLDLGAFTPILYAFDDREAILDILQRSTGSRLTYSSFRLGGVQFDLDEKTVQMIRDFIPAFRKRLPMYKNLVTDNIILRNRVEGIGELSQEAAARYGCTGPVARGSGIQHDVRRNEPYSLYDRFDFEVPTQESCCSAGRYLVRMDEMEQTLRIVEQALDGLEKASGKHIMDKAPKPNWKAPAGEAWFAIESGRGKVGVHVVSDGSKTPYRVKLRSPSYSNLSSFAEVAQGVLIGDAVAILGSLDLIIPEIDR